MAITQPRALPPLYRLYRRRTAHRLFVFEGLDLAKRPKDAGLVREALALADQLGLPLSRVGRHDLNLLSGDRPHQAGLVPPLGFRVLGFRAAAPGRSCAAAVSRRAWLRSLRLHLH